MINYDQLPLVLSAFKKGSPSPQQQTCFLDWFGYNGLAWSQYHRVHIFCWNGSGPRETLRPPGEKMKITSKVLVLWLITIRKKTRQSWKGTGSGPLPSPPCQGLFLPRWIRKHFGGIRTFFFLLLSWNILRNQRKKDVCGQLVRFGYFQCGTEDEKSATSFS